MRRSPTSSEKQESDLVSKEYLGIVSYMPFRDGSDRELLVIKAGRDSSTSAVSGDRLSLSWPVEATSIME